MLIQEFKTISGQCSHFQRDYGPKAPHIRKNFFTLKKKTLWPLFMDGVQLSQG